MIREKISIAKDTKMSRKYLLKDEDGNYIDLSTATLLLACKDEIGNTEALGTVIGNTDGFTVEIDVTGKEADTVHFCQVMREDTSEVLREFLIYIREFAK